jgi:hypothetical protein
MAQMLILLTLLGFELGGWAVITVKDLPDQIVVGQPFTLEFTVRQHGRTLLSNLNPRVTAAASAERVDATVRPSSSAGTYTAALTLPHPGDWTLTIYSGSTRDVP